ncbi:hypothetical protein Fmac_029384 [Flemingia macrophylla]|uniref:Uncharacterized protein n=1 Tax=Flemingia macrophylla TaxID=520843 RepID=A0ABD1LA63_9FABA
MFPYIRKPEINGEYSSHNKLEHEAKIPFISSIMTNCMMYLLSIKQGMYSPLTH